MRKLGLIAVVAAATLLAGCGGSTKTVTVTSATPSTTPSTSNAGGASGNVSAVAACFTAAGATVRGPHPAGPGTAIYAVTRDSGNVGFVKAANAAIATRLAQVFPSSGWKVKQLTNDPTAFAIYQSTLTSADSALLSKCTKGR
jgi:hypothetical protein